MIQDLKATVSSQPNKNVSQKTLAENFGGSVCGSGAVVVSNDTRLNMGLFITTQVETSTAAHPYYTVALPLGWVTRLQRRYVFCRQLALLAALDSPFCQVDG